MSDAWQVMHTRAERKMLPYRQPAREACFKEMKMLPYR